jgi:hypothetical protein
MNDAGLWGVPLGTSGVSPYVKLQRRGNVAAEPGAAPAWFALWPQEESSARVGAGLMAGMRHGRSVKAVGANDAVKAGGAAGAEIVAAKPLGNFR